MATRWGVVGNGKVADDFAVCVRNLDPHLHKLVAVASNSSLERAKQFGERHSISKTYGTYAELSKDSNVDVVYVCCDHSGHFEASKLMLQSGKHVLCEKPMTISPKQTTELVQLAKQHKRFLMEGIWSRFFPAYNHVKGLLDAKTFGEPLQIIANFGQENFYVDNEPREGKESSVTFDIGVYAIQLCNFVFNKSDPKVLLVKGGFTKSGVDNNLVAVLDYGDGRLANITLSRTVFLGNSATIGCQKNYIQILPAYHCPTKIEVNGKIIEFPLPKINHQFNFPFSSGLTYEIEEVRRCLQEGLLESPAVTWQESVDIAMTIEKIRKDILK